jgi:hypothetical protein
MSTQCDCSVDVVLCLDQGQSMQAMLNSLRKNGIEMPANLQQSWTRRGQRLRELRVKIVAFGAIQDDQNSRMSVSKFYSIPDEREGLGSFMASVTPISGPGAKNSLAALAVALKSPWRRRVRSQRHVIVILTDSPAHTLEEKADGDFDYNALPRDLAELTDLWNGQAISQTAKRMVIFGPEEYPWTYLLMHWEQVLFVPTRIGGGIMEHQYNEVLYAIFWDW